MGARGWKRQCVYVRPLYLKESKETVQFFCQCSVSVHSHVVAAFVVCDVLYLLPQPPWVNDCKMVLYFPLRFLLGIFMPLRRSAQAVLCWALPKGNVVVSQMIWASLVIQGFGLTNIQIDWSTVELSAVLDVR